MEMQHLKTVNASFVKAESERWGGCAWVCYWEFVRLWRLHAQELAHAHTLFFFPLGQNQNKPLINSRQHHQAIDWLPSSISLIKPLRPFDKVASNSLLESDWNKFNVWWFDFRKKNNQTLFKIQVRMHQKKGTQFCSVWIRSHVVIRTKQRMIQDQPLRRGTLVEKSFTATHTRGEAPGAVETRQVGRMQRRNTRHFHIFTLSNYITVLIKPKWRWSPSTNQGLIVFVFVEEKWVFIIRQPQVVTPMSSSSL